MILLESFTYLLHDPAHWKFELLVSAVEQVFGFIVVSVLIQGVIWPRIKSHFHADIEDGVHAAKGGPGPWRVDDDHTGHNHEREV
jgi:hypothetical protein